MPIEMSLKYDKVGVWSKIKLEIIRKHAPVYSQILARRFYHIYIDAFAGAGKHIDKNTGESTLGSLQAALDITPPFREYHFIDIDSAIVNELHQISARRPEVKVYHGDCNRILLEEVFPKVCYEESKRGLCLLDPYGLHLKWEVIQTAGQMKSIDMLLSFPIADINRNVLWGNPECVHSTEIQRMNNYWGDESWREIVYSTQNNTLGRESKQDDKKLVLAFQQRLCNVAGFNNVSTPVPMRDSRGNVIYFLFFASQKQLAYHTIQNIFNKYSKKGAISKTHKTDTVVGTEQGTTSYGNQVEV